MFDSQFRTQSDHLDTVLKSMGVCPKCWGEEIGRLVYSGKRGVYTYEVGMTHGNEPLVLAWYVDELIEMAAFSDTKLIINNKTLEAIYSAPNNVDVDHLPHVDESIPGIMVESEFSNCGFIFADGNHRAYKSWQLGKDFQAMLLTREQSERCLLNPTPITYGDVQEISDSRIAFLQMVGTIPSVAGKMREHIKTKAVQVLLELAEKLKAQTL